MLTKKHVIAATLVTLFASYPVLAASYSFQDLYTLGVPAGSDFAGATFISPFSAGPGGQIVGGADNAGVGTGATAMIWSTTTPSGTSLATDQYAVGTNGNEQVGYGSSALSTIGSGALLWSGTAASKVDLSPVVVVSGIPVVEWYFSLAYAVENGQQVGVGELVHPGASHALLWSGTGTSFVDLHPAGFSNSEAHGLYSDPNPLGVRQQVGFGLNTLANQVHALLWTGTAASAVDLNPSGFGYSHAVGTDGVQQVGYGDDVHGQSHALLWTGTAQSAVDLGPGTALAINHGMEVGLAGQNVDQASTGNVTIWSGSAASAVNLSALMPSTFFVPYEGINSLANAPLYLDANGNVFGYALDNSTQLYHAIEFSPVPEPSSAAIGISAVLTLLVCLLRREVRNARFG